MARGTWRAVAVIAAVLWMAEPAGGLQTPPPSTIAEAQRLRDAGEFTAAARILRAVLAQQPDNGDAARLLAQTLYWLQDVAGARVVYEAALVRHPQDTTLRIQYGRLLIDTGQRTRARAVLEPLRGIGTTQAEANALLGTLAYWDGDLTTARRLFEAALATDQAHADAMRQLQEIRAVSAPWVRFSSGLRRDDQPLDRGSFGVEAGWFLTPLAPVTIRVQPTTYRLDDSSARRVLAVEGAVAHFAPAFRLETELAAGMLRRAEGTEPADWTGRAVLGIRLPRHVTLRARAERTPYLHTRSSLDTPVMVQSGTGLVRWQDPRGWLGEAAYQRQRYPDGNLNRTVYAWLMAPVVGRPAAQLQAGYAFTRAHADESRFVLASPVQPYLPGDPRFDMTGRYAPYYTPSHVVTHSAIGAVTGRPSPRTTLHLGGAYALHATEDAPVLFLSSTGQLDRTMYTRDFSPWNARASLEVRLNDNLTLTAAGETGRTAFYGWSTADLHVTYRFRKAP